MNERIRELWWKARIGYNNQSCDNEVIEKFAELIVKECFGCIGIMEKIANSTNASIPKDYDKHTYLETLGTMRGLVEAHFGVEE